MNKVIIGIGIPGSGKTTILKKFAEENQYSYICPDDIRKEISGNAADQSVNARAWSIAKHRVMENIGSGKTIVFDATFAKRGDRRGFIDELRQYGVKNIQGVFVDVPLDIALERNAQRERQVPEEVVKRMQQSLRDYPPKIEEGLDSMFVLDKDAKIVKSMLGEHERISKK